MTEQRWLRIIPVALIMYTISYVDRTNVALALDPRLSTMMTDLGMTDRVKGNAVGIFFWGYLLLQIPGGWLASHWSARKIVSIFLVCWGAAAVGCGLVHTVGQFKVMRFLLGIAESGVFPATLVLLANWFPRTERARANAYWNLCQPLAVAGAAPITGALLGHWGWRTALILEGALPFIWLPIWWFFIRDHPREAKWISHEEREHLETTLARETAHLSSGVQVPLWRTIIQPAVFVMVPVYFLQNCAAYGCNTFLSEALKSPGLNFTPFHTGILYAIPYLVAAVVMVLNSRHSDKMQERRGHVAFVYALSGACLIISVLLRKHNFWVSYGFLCMAIPGPFAGLAPFWAIPAETLPRHSLGIVMGLVNAMGNVGGWAGNYVFGWLKEETKDVTVPFGVLGAGLLLAALLCFLLPKSKPHVMQKLEEPVGTGGASA
ncbi:MAG TPA: MFS transporter [Candidatus Saccharimonadales bacterium]|nr:MFS transporter [Candidatus Saccharimonadales bacterium]